MDLNYAMPWVHSVYIEQNGDLKFFNKHMTCISEPSTTLLYCSNLQTCMKVIVPMCISVIYTTILLFSGLPYSMILVDTELFFYRDCPPIKEIHYERVKKGDIIGMV